MQRTLVREIQEKASGERHLVHGQGTQCWDVCQSSHHGRNSSPLSQTHSSSFCGYQKHKSKVNARRPMVQDIQEDIEKQTNVGRLP